MIPDDLYASEINFKIESDWDGGINVALGNDRNGIVEQTTVATFDEACEWLRNAAMRHYPDSVFARNRRA